MPEADQISHLYPLAVPVAAIHPDGIALSGKGGKHGGTPRNRVVADILGEDVEKAEAFGAKIGEASVRAEIGAVLGEEEVAEEVEGVAEG